MHMKRITALALSGLLVTGLAACGDDGDDGDDVGLEDASGSGSGSGSGSASGVEDDTDSDSDADDELPDFDPSDIPNLSGDCEVLVNASLAFAEAFAGTDEVDFDDLAGALQEFADSAPDEVADDVAVLAEAYARFAEEFGDFDFSDPAALSDPETAARFAEAGEIFNTDEFTQASENLSDFATENCSVVDE